MPSYLIVGASRGLGYEWLLQLSKDPSNIVVGIIRTFSPSLNSLTTSHPNIHLIPGDMTSPTSLTLAAHTIQTTITPNIDYLIVNGAFFPITNDRFQPTEYTDRTDILREEMRTSLDVNVLGVIYSINAFLSLVREGGIKKVVVISSGMADAEWVATNSVPGSIIYASMKAATNMIVAKYAVELKPEGITLLALSPGIVDTRSDQKLSEDELKGVLVLAAGASRIYPDWKGPSIAEESVIAMKKVIEAVTLEQSGAFLSHKGDKVWL